MALFKKLVLGTALAASAMTAAAPASAQTYYRNYHSGNDTAATAIGAGIIGLAVGALLGSSSNRGYDNRYYNGGNYRNGTYYEGYRYNNGWFYDRQNQRRYDRNTWERRHEGDRQSQYQGSYQTRDDYDRYDDRGQYGSAYNGGYDRGYDNGTSYGTAYNGGSYNGSWSRGY